MTLIEQIIEYVRTSGEPKTLKITHERYLKGHGTVFARVFSSLPQLETVSLTENDFSPAELVAIVAACETLPRLKKLSLSCNDIDNTVAEAIANNKSCRGSLESLDLSGPEYGTSFISSDAIVAQMVSNFPHLKQLFLIKQKLTKIDKLANALKEKASFEHLNLSLNPIGDEGASMLANILSRNFKLNTLFLTNTKIGSQGARALAGALETNQHLKTLSLHNNNIGNEGATAIAALLRSGKSAVTQLLLSKNKIGRRGVIELAKSLRVNASLLELSLSNGSRWAFDRPAPEPPFSRFGAYVGIREDIIDDQAIIELANALKVNATLEKLDLTCNNYITLNGIRAIADALKCNKSLKSLSLYNEKSFYENDTSHVAHMLVIIDALKINTTLIEMDYSELNYQEASTIKGLLARNLSFQENRKRCQSVIESALRIDIASQFEKTLQDLKSVASTNTNLINGSELNEYKDVLSELIVAYEQLISLERVKISGLRQYGRIAQSLRGQSSQTIESVLTEPFAGYHQDTNYILKNMDECISVARNAFDFFSDVKPGSVLFRRKQFLLTNLKDDLAAVFVPRDKHSQQLQIQSMISSIQHNYTNEPVRFSIEHNAGDNPNCRNSFVTNLQSI